ncbi:GD25637 [Drosophila simulans]|uniref:GD25637 n=1 Tax=Drosophila simulans TaxID=7240 RepID=B4QGD4_DROSI|nr:GD25637 [Drosophila simulans]
MREEAKEAKVSEEGEYEQGLVVSIPSTMKEESENDRTAHHEKFQQTEMETTNDDAGNADAQSSAQWGDVRLALEMEQPEHPTLPSLPLKWKWPAKAMIMMVVMEMEMMMMMIADKGAAWGLEPVREQPSVDNMWATSNPPEMFFRRQSSLGLGGPVSPSLARCKL